MEPRDYDRINLADKMAQIRMKKGSDELREALIREHPRIIRILTSKKGANNA